MNTKQSIDRSNTKKSTRLTWRLSFGVKPTSVHFATNRSPARGAIGSKIIPSLSRISNRGIVSLLIDTINEHIKYTKKRISMKLKMTIERFTE